MRSLVFSTGESPLRFYAGVVFDVRGIGVTSSLGIEHLYEEFQKFPHFEEVEKSWGAACARVVRSEPLDYYDGEE